MFTISVETNFRAWHRLTLPDGSKEPLHRHKWRVIVDISSEKLDGMGIVLDFRTVRAMLDDITKPLGEGKMEQIDYFQRNNPSAEAVAEYIYEKLKPELAGNTRLASVRVCEQPGHWAKFSK